MRGPHEDLEGYLEATDQIKSLMLFFGDYMKMKNTNTILDNCNNLLSKAISKLEDEFRDLLKTHRLYFSNLHDLSFYSFPLAAFMPTCWFNALCINTLWKPKQTNLQSKSSLRAETSFSQTTTLKLWNDRMWPIFRYISFFSTRQNNANY